MNNRVEAFDAKLDRQQTRERLRVASLKLLSVAWRCALVDAALVFFWIFVSVAPLIGNNNSFVVKSLTPASMMLLCVLCSLGPAFVSAFRLIMVMGFASKAVRVDRMSGARTRLRQVSFSFDNARIGWWFTFGYIGVLVYATFNVLVVVLWSLVFGVSIWIIAFLLLFTAMSAVSVFGCTSSLYERGIERNMRRNVTQSKAHEDQWARFRAAEARLKWFGKKK